MAKYDPEEKVLSVVLIGNFNPIIFQPQWFANQEIITKADLNDILDKNEVLVHNQVTQFSTSWLNIQITENRANFTTTQEAYFEMLLDLITSTFSILSHTPISKFGMNLTVTHKLSQSNEVELFENRYYPKGGFTAFDQDYQQTQLKLQLSNSKIKLGDICNFELLKQDDKTFKLHINQHFELGEKTNGKDFVIRVTQIGRSCIKVNDNLMKSIIEVKG